MKNREIFWVMFFASLAFVLVLVFDYSLDLVAIVIFGSLILFDLDEIKKKLRNLKR